MRRRLFLIPSMTSLWWQQRLAISEGNGRSVRAARSGRRRPRRSGAGIYGVSATFVIDQKGVVRLRYAGQSCRCIAEHNRGGDHDCGAGKLNSPYGARRASRHFFWVVNHICCSKLVRCRGYQRQRSDEPTALRRRKRLKQGALRPFRRQSGAAQYPASCLRDGNGVRAAVSLRPATRQKSAGKHPPNHFGKRRAINPGGFDKRGLVRAVVLIKRSEQQILLLRQILAAGFQRKQITEKLIAPAKEMRWSA